jgi:hypothetical protein
MQPITGSLLAHLRFHLFDSTKFDAGAALGFALLHPSPEVFFREHFEVGVNFFVQVRVHTIRPEEIAQEASGPHKERHGELHSTPVGVL